MSEIFTSIKRTPYQSFASFLILFFTLFISLFIFNFTSFLDGVLGFVETRPQVVAYFTVTAKEDQILKIKKTVEQSGKTSSVKYISQKQALEIYKELNKDNPLLLEMVTADILPASLEIYAKKPSYLSEIATFLKKEQVIDEVSYQKNIVDRLLTLTTILRKLSLAFFSLLIITSVIVLMTTTAFKIALKKDEIDLLRLIGAGKLYIIKPFLLEGVFFGVLSALCAFGVYFGIYFYFEPFIKSYLTGFTSLTFFNLGAYGLYVFPPSGLFILFSCILLIIFGVLIGVVGNFISTQKYIK